MNLQDGLNRGLGGLDLIVSDQTRQRLLDYLALLEKWNRVHNLTAVREKERMIGHHLLDSLSVLPHLKGIERLADVGSGAGLPGIPLAIVAPQLQVCLIESSQKKVAFLQQAVIELELSHVGLRNERVEESRPEQPFDAVISRAFSELADFVRLAGHLVKEDGVLLAMKGVHPFDEIERLPAEWQVREVIPLQIPELAATRHLVKLVRRR